ncbi:unnamed protein product [Ranitomeya imitator]|uniref:Uncharacterized protein n=1 Tax=Ranitomeya imitator TaxID=111125 RepID=A0ABN9KXD2_9NEOB|nr:unnamed protein product [Ranitomeya imitator]
MQIGILRDNKSTAKYKSALKEVYHKRDKSKKDTITNVPLQFPCDQPEIQEVTQKHPEPEETQHQQVQAENVTPAVELENPLSAIEYIGGLSTAFQNAEDKPLMPVGLTHLRFWGGILEKKLAASVNIMPKSSSLYIWKGEIEESSEVLLIVKTRTARLHELSGYVRFSHPFAAPDFMTVSIDLEDLDYSRYIEEVTVKK